jgi:hypothetical protein
MQLHKILVSEVCLMTSAVVETDLTRHCEQISGAV